MQVKNTTDQNDKVPFFKEDTCYWFERVEKKGIDYFPLSERFLNKNNIQLQEKNKVQIKGISKLWKTRLITVFQQHKKRQRMTSQMQNFCWYKIFVWESKTTFAAFITDTFLWIVIFSLHSHQDETRKPLKCKNKYSPAVISNWIGYRAKRYNHVFSVKYLYIIITLII